MREKKTKYSNALRKTASRLDFFPKGIKYILGTTGKKFNYGQLFR